MSYLRTEASDSFRIEVPNSPGQRPLAGRVTDVCALEYIQMTLGSARTKATETSYLCAGFCIQTRGCLNLCK